MKTLLLFIAFLFTGNALAGEATFNWLKPFPMFEENADGSPAVVPPDWTIDEYRLKCTVSVSGQPAASYTRTILGYDTETVTYTDLPNGDTTCIMTSWSAGNGLESIDSNSVTKFVMDPVFPAPPTVFDFVPLAAVQGIRSPILRSRTVIISANSRRHVVYCDFKIGITGKRLTACSEPWRL